MKSGPSTSSRNAGLDIARLATSTWSSTRQWPWSAGSYVRTPSNRVNFPSSGSRPRPYARNPTDAPGGARVTLRSEPAPGDTGSGAAVTATGRTRQQRARVRIIGDHQFDMHRGIYVASRGSAWLFRQPANRATHDPPPIPPRGSPHHESLLGPAPAAPHAGILPHARRGAPELRGPSPRRGTGRRLPGHASGHRPAARRWRKGRCKRSTTRPISTSCATAPPHGPPSPPPAPNWSPTSTRRPR